MVGNRRSCSVSSGSGSLWCDCQPHPADLTATAAATCYGSTIGVAVDHYASNGSATIADLGTPESDKGVPDICGLTLSGIHASASAKASLTRTGDGGTIKLDSTVSVTIIGASRIASAEWQPASSDPTLSSLLLSFFPASSPTLKIVVTGQG